MSEGGWSSGCPTREVHDKGEGHAGCQRLAEVAQVSEIEAMRVTKLIRREFEVIRDRGMGYCPVRYFGEWRLVICQVLPNETFRTLHWEVAIERGGEGGPTWRGEDESQIAAFDVALNKLTDDL